MKNITCQNPANIASLTSSKAKSVVLSKWRRCVQVRSEHTAFRGTFISFFLLLAPAQGTDPKKCDPCLLRRSNFEGSVPWAGARRKKKEKKKEETRFGQSCWRGTRGPRESAIVLPYRDPKNYASTCPHGYTILRKTLWCRGQAPMNRDRLRIVLRGVHIHGSEVKR